MSENISFEEQCELLIKEVQDIKAPIDEARTKAQKEVEKLSGSVQGKISSLKEDIRNAHREIEPLDQLMRSAMHAKRMRGTVRNAAIAAAQAELDKVKSDLAKKRSV